MFEKFGGGITKEELGMERFVEELELEGVGE